MNLNSIMKQNYDEPHMREYQVQIRRGICQASQINTDNVEVTNNPFEGTTEENW